MTFETVAPKVPADNVIGVVVAIGIPSGPLSSTTDRSGDASPTVAVMGASAPDSTWNEPAVASTVGGVVSSSISATAGADTLPALSRSCTATALVPSPAESVNWTDAANGSHVPPGAVPFATRICIAPDAPALPTATVTFGLFVYVAPLCSRTAPERLGFEMSSASIATRLPDDVTTICTVPAVGLAKRATGNARVDEGPARFNDAATLPFHFTETVPHDEHVPASSVMPRATTWLRPSVAPFLLATDSVPPSAPLTFDDRVKVEVVSCTSSSGTLVQRSTDQFDVFASWSRARVEKQ